MEYTIRREKWRDNGEDLEYFDVYASVEGDWVLMDSFQFRENAEKYIENEKKKEK